VLETLKQEILSAYGPGDLLPNERALAERFGVGRNTVREAVIFLEAYGLIEKTQRGARVRDREVAFDFVFATFDSSFDRSLAMLRDLVEFRRHLETGILDRVVANATGADLDDLEAILVRMERALTAREAATADFAFHAKMVDISQNAVVRRLYQTMAETMTYYLEIGKTKYGAETVARHRAIVTALRTRDVVALRRAVAGHFTYSEAVLNSELIAEA
jgi:DNA-binding FadR family transcriptional regulator